MPKAIYKIGLFTQNDRDFFALTNLCEKITDLNITLRNLSADKTIITEKKYAEIPIYLVYHEYFDDNVFQNNLAEIRKSNAPVVCILDKASDEQTQKALAYQCDFWLFKNILNPAILESTLLRARQVYRLKEEAHYLRQKFHESEKRFLSVIRSKAEAIILINQNNLIRFVNPACEKQFGIAHANIGQIFPYNLEAGQIREIDLLPLTGKHQKVEIVVGELVWENENCLTISFRDTTEQHRLETELLTFRHVIHLSPLPIFITDKYSNIIYVNDSFEKTTGYKSDEIIGKKPKILKSGVHDNNFYNELWTTILSGETWTGQICNKTKKGDLYWEKQLVSAVKNTDDEIEFFISIRVDDVERRKKEKELQKAETLKSVQELAGGIAHEFSQPLQVLSISMSLIEKEIGNSEYYDKANKMIQRIIELVNNLKSITAIRQQDYLSTKILDIKASSKKIIRNNEKPLILIIDDETELMESLVEVLHLSGYECYGVSNGPDALEKLSQNNYSLIISDIDMPQMGGIELFKRIKKTSFDGYFIFMTGYELDSDNQDFIKLADGLLTKPFHLNELKNLVDRIFKVKPVST